jgi:hypothetical protein
MHTLSPPLVGSDLVGNDRVTASTSGMFLTFRYRSTSTGKDKRRKLLRVSTAFACGGLWKGRSVIISNGIVDTSNLGRENVMWSIGSSPILRTGSEEAFQLDLEKN